METSNQTKEYFPATDKPEEDLVLAFSGIEELLAIDPQTSDSEALRKRHEERLREFSLGELEELHRKIPNGKIIAKILEEKRAELPLAA